MNLERIFRLILGLSFLPDGLRRWIFGTGTRALEVLNVACLCGWSAVMLLDERLLSTTNYRAFAELSPSEWLNEVLSAVFACMAVLCFCGLFWRHFRLQLLAGVAMIASALTWALVTAAFWASYPPFNTAVIVYAVLSAMCLLAGEHLIFVSQVKREMQESRPVPLE